MENKGHRGHEKPIPSGDVNIAIEIAIYKWIYPLNMVIFHSYVSLPEGTVSGWWFGT